MYTRFSGDDDRNPARWLRTIKYELPPTFTPGQWLECVDGLLDGEAARWADKSPNVKKILSDEDLKHAGKRDVATFKTLFLNRFTPADERLKDVNHMLETLRQNATESLEDYYGRAEDLLLALGGKDKTISVKLSNHETSILKRVIHHYVHGLHYSYLKSNAALQSDSLSKAYELTGQGRILAMENVYMMSENYR